MSMLQSDALREAISGIMGDATEKKRNFVETIELQIGLKKLCKTIGGKFLEAKVNETKAMVKFQLKKVRCLNLKSTMGKPYPVF